MLSRGGRDGRDITYLVGCLDATHWAREFMRLWGHRLDKVDEGLMLTWFANAIMAGYDHKRGARPKAPLRGGKG